MGKDVSLARAVHETRRAQRLSQRELARRSGVAPSQISRIESGEIAQPGEFTVLAIAQALARPPEVLSFIAGYAAAEEIAYVLDQHSDTRVETSAEHDVWAELPDRVLERMREVAFDYFLTTPAIDGYLADAPGMAQVFSCWPGLTDERRGFVVRFVEDQLALSELERRRKPDDEGAIPTDAASAR